MSNTKTNTTNKVADNKPTATCCNTCDCGICTCGCKPGSCQCAATNCQCGCQR